MQPTVGIPREIGPLLGQNRPAIDLAVCTSRAFTVRHQPVRNRVEPLWPVRFLQPKISGETLTIILHTLFIKNSAGLHTGHERLPEPTRNHKSPTELDLHPISVIAIVPSDRNWLGGTIAPIEVRVTRRLEAAREAVHESDKIAVHGGRARS
jgi:hypothetical protein